MVVNSVPGWCWRQKHDGLVEPSASSLEGFLKFALLLFRVQVCIDKEISQVTKSDAATMLERGLIVLFALLSFGVALEGSAVYADLQ